MKERPILFSAPMVRALLAGTKSQTRRIVRGWPLEWLQPGMFTPEYVAAPENRASRYGYPGDRLYVKETLFINHYMGLQVPEEERADCELHYRATDEAALRQMEDTEGLRWTPSIHCPRWASRIDLDVTGLRIERLQDISEADARAEGVDFDPGEGGVYWVPSLGCASDTAAGSFRKLWESINGSESWAANPWVWVVDFKPPEVAQ